jgi:hypothetical protein
VTEYLTKRIGKEELWVRNLDLEDERKAIERMEAGEEEGNGIEEEDEEPKLPAIVVGKHKADKLIEEDDDLELEVKHVRFMESGLLNFEGPVSSLHKSYPDIAHSLHSAIAAPRSR